MHEKPWNAPIHPAEHLREDFMEPLGLTAEQAAEAMRLPLAPFEAFLREEAPLTGALALRLARAFGADADYWMRWQARYELEVAKDAADEADLKAIANLNPRRDAA